MSAKQSVIVGALVALAGYLAAGFLNPGAAPFVGAKRTFGPPSLAATLGDPQISESSGIARSNRYGGWYYTHNDSGDSARFWRFNLKGQIVGPIAATGAQSIDWEDMASARIDGKDYLYFADIGDNAMQRAVIQVYRAEEPAPGASTVVAERYDLTYPDGPHNAEAFVVHPQTGAFAIVVKGSVPRPNVYWLRASKPGAHQLELMGALAMPYASGESRLVTGGDASADGRFIVIRTYQAGFEFELGDSFESWIGSKPLRVGLAQELQGEAIGYSADGRRLVTTSEFSPCRISTVEIFE